MPTLDWIGKKAVINHHRQVPYHLLKCDNSLSCGDPESGNLLVEGDNLLALKALLPYYAGQVKCIYIDPPYNTGKEGWTYNDNVNAPEIRKWLGKVVGKEADDLSRHDKWLCMMYPRLSLLWEFLEEGGVIFISIGKDEVGRLRVLCDELFDTRNLLEVFIWQIEGNVENQEAITATHEYVLAYEKKESRSRINQTIDPNVDDGSKLLRDFAENSVIKNGPGNPASIIELPVGFPCAVQELDLPRHEFAKEFIKTIESDEGYIKREIKQRFNARYPIRLDKLIVRSECLAEPCRVYSGWSSARKLRRYIECGCQPLIEEDGSRLRFFISHTGVPTYRRDEREAHFVETILRNMGTTEKSSNELERMGVRFTYPKPVGLVKYLLSLYAKPGDIVLDSFCGSGTTGHATLELNIEKTLGLRFILVELEQKVAGAVTVPRLRAVIQGYSARRGNKHIEEDGLGGGFRYCRLDKPLFDETGKIGEKVRFGDLAAHVFFTETGRPIPKRTNGASPFLGKADGTGYYLLFNGILGDKTPDGGNVLTGKVLENLPKHNGPKVIFGEGCRLGDARLRREKIAFKQLPYEIKVS